MKKNYIFLLSFIFCIWQNNAKAQTCTSPSSPAVSGITVAPCVTSSDFTLTASPSTLATGWYYNSWGGNALATGSVYTTPTLTSGATYYVGQFVSSTGPSSIALPPMTSIITNSARGFYFTAPADFIITGLRVPTDVGTAGNSHIAVVKLSNTPPLWGNTTNNFSTLYYDPAITGTNIVSVYIPVYSGDIIGVLGGRLDVYSYSSVQPYATTLAANTVTLSRLGMQFNLSTSAPQDLWTEPGNLQPNLARIEVYTEMGCLSPLTPVTVTISPTLPVSISGPTANICANTSITLTATGGTNFAWSGGPSPTSSSQVISPTSTITYSVTGSLNANCSNTAAITITVDTSIPSLTAVRSSSSVCYGSTVTLNGVGATSYSWTGSSVNSITNSVAFTPTSTSSYTVVSTNGCGTGSAVTSITVNPNPTVSIANTGTSLCTGEVGTLTASGAANYVWTYDNSTNTTLTVSPSFATVFQVDGTDSFGCKGSSQVVIVPKPSPTVNIAADKSLICSGDAVNLTASGAGSYLWAHSPTSSVIVENPQVSTMYTVTGFHATNSCTDEAVALVSVFIPTVLVSSSQTICAGKSASLNASGADTYTWSTSSQFPWIVVSPLVNTSYTISTTTSSNSIVSCTTSNIIQVTVNSNPTVTANSARSTICKNETVLLSATGAPNYSWSTSGSTPTISVSESVAGTYTYEVTGLGSNGCKAAAIVLLKVNSCTGISEVPDRIPLTVYPNPNNGQFALSSDRDMSLVLTDAIGRWVQTVELKEITHFKASVNSLPEGIYFIRNRSGGDPINLKIIVNNKQ